MDHTSLVGHNHSIIEQTEITNDAHCRFCLSTNPTAYWRCMICDICMSKNCIKLPQEVTHWLHPQHPLRMYNACSRRMDDMLSRRMDDMLRDDMLSRRMDDMLSRIMDDMLKERGICEGCNHFRFYHRCYKCTRCEFRLCTGCCTSTTSRRPLQWENKKLHHDSHVHELTRCRVWEELLLLRCSICELKMWGVGYACVRCYHFIHESCMVTPQVLQHPFHPLHPFKRLNYSSLGTDEDSCNACLGDFISKIEGLHCYDCTFSLHSRCANYVLRMIKLECHTHGLICFRGISGVSRSGKECPVCGMHIGEGETYSAFRCVECDINFHFDCASIPRCFKHGHHQHTLTLADPCDEDRSDEYYCDICEARRDSNSYAYRCEQCNFFGHIECLLSKEEGFPQVSSSLDVEPKQLNKIELQRPPDYSSNKQIQHACHRHPLNLEKATNRHCCMCQLEINGRAYRCEKCEEEFWVHEQCVELPENLDHPLHPNRKLSLLKDSKERSFEQIIGKCFICSLCSEISRGFNFSCRICDFVIDIRCALNFESGQPFDNKEYRKTLTHLVHDHELTLGNARRETAIQCKICEKWCSNLTYCCTLCKFYAHKACVEWPSVVEPHILHPDHRLLLSRLGYTECECYACGYRINILGYECEKCGAPNQSCRVNFHLECGISLARLLKQKHHNHHFYYIHKQLGQGVGRYYFSAYCSICRGEKEGSYYKCLKCNHNFHLGCLRLPQTAKHKWHLHPLTFKDSVDYGGYYCDICEEPRDFQHPVYCCKHCNFVAHAECIVSKENASSVTLEETESDHEYFPECSPASPYSSSTSD